MDDEKTVILLKLLRSVLVRMDDLNVQVQALIDCLNLVPDFQKAFEDQKKRIRDSAFDTRNSVLAEIDSMIQKLKKSNGGA